MARGAAWMMAIRWCVRGLDIILLIILARLLTADDFGIFAAATLVVVIMATRAVVYEPVVISTSGRLVVSNALAAAHEAEQRHAEAIAELQRAADPILDRAHDPQTGAAEAALLLAYRDRISAIDSAIAEVNSYLDENPGLASARTVLLAAYIDKTRILEEVLGRDDRGELG